MRTNGIGAIQRLCRAVGRHVLGRLCKRKCNKATLCNLPTVERDNTVRHFRITSSSLRMERSETQTSRSPGERKNPVPWTRLPSRAWRQPLQNCGRDIAMHATQPERNYVSPTATARAVRVDGPRCACRREHHT